MHYIVNKSYLQNILFIKKRLEIIYNDFLTDHLNVLIYINQTNTGYVNNTLNIVYELLSYINTTSSDEEEKVEENSNNIFDKHDPLDNYILSRQGNPNIIRNAPNYTTESQNTSSSLFLDKSIAFVVSTEDNKKGKYKIYNRNNNKQFTKNIPEPDDSILLDIPKSPIKTVKPSANIKPMSIKKREMFITPVIPKSASVSNNESNNVVSPPPKQNPPPQKTLNSASKVHDNNVRIVLKDKNDPKKIKIIIKNTEETNVRPEITDTREMINVRQEVKNVSQRVTNVRQEVTDTGEITDTREITNVKPNVENKSIKKIQAPMKGIIPMSAQKNQYK